MHPIKAHILCCRTRILLVISIIWPSSMVCLPQPVLSRDHPHRPRVHTLRHPVSKPLDFIIFKYCEFFLFYFIPLVLQ
ncbi:hypothetical protein CEXT_376461, partial [Caerostris extrusa]